MRQPSTQSPKNASANVAALAHQAMQSQLANADVLCALVSGLVEYFFGLNASVQFVAATPEPAYFWELQDFYAAQVPLTKDPDSISQLRLSQQFCHWFIEKTLGKSATQTTDFDFATLTGFEVQLLEDMSQYVFDQLQHQFAAPEEKDALSAGELMQAVSGSQKIYYYLLVSPAKTQHVSLPVVITLPAGFKVKAVDADAGTTPKDKKVLSWPQAAIEQLTTVNARFAVGKTRVKLSDLKQLGRGDVVLLENSRLTQWHWWDARNQNWVTMRIALSPQARIKRYQPVGAQESVESQRRDVMGTANPQQWHYTESERRDIMNYWENLEVDVLASFEPQKFPIKRLQEISEGLVVEVGSLMNNRIMLSVDGQAVAYGELVVIGNQFGVRVKGLYPPGTKLIPGASDLAPYDEDELQDQYDEEGDEDEDDDAAQPTTAGQDDDDLLDDLDLTEADFDGEDDGNWQ